MYQSVRFTAVDFAFILMYDKFLLSSVTGYGFIQPFTTKSGVLLAQRKKAFQNIWGDGEYV